MEDIVALEVTLDTAEKRYFLTWGRVHNAVDPSPLEALMQRVSPTFALGGRPVSSRLCASLQDAAGQPYFFECFFAMCQKKIPFGPGYADWAKKTQHAMNAGKEIYYLGRPTTGQHP
jgi:hypothetical protein